MNISSELQIKSGHKVYVENPPVGFLVDLPEGAQLVDREDAADAVLVFAKDGSELNAHSPP